MDVWWGDACRLLRNKLKSHQPVELLFLDGLPSQYLDYLHAAEHSLAPGALVIADNAGIFAEGGLRTYLEYVRNSSSYSSRFIASQLEWEPTVADGLEVSQFVG